MQTCRQLTLLLIVVYHKNRKITTPTEKKLRMGLSNSAGSGKMKDDKRVIISRGILLEVTPVEIGTEIVGVRIAVRDLVNPCESQIYNWGIKKDTSLDGMGRGTNNRISQGISSNVSNTIIAQNLELSTQNSKKSLPVDNLELIPPRQDQSQTLSIVYHNH